MTIQNTIQNVVYSYYPMRLHLALKMHNVELFKIKSHVLQQSCKLCETKGKMLKKNLNMFKNLMWWFSNLSFFACQQFIYRIFP